MKPSESIIGVTVYLILLLAVLPCRLSAAGTDARKYDASWESLLQHEVPEWLIDAKFGIYAHWGVYSAPAFGNEWYASAFAAAESGLRFCAAAHPG